MGISFRYKGARGSATTEESVNQDFNADLQYLSTREELGLELDPEPANIQPQAQSEAPVESKSPLLKLAEFIKNELRNLEAESPEAQKIQKVISLYENGNSKGIKKQKGLQLKKVA